MMCWYCNSIHLAIIMAKLYHVMELAARHYLNLNQRKTQELFIRCAHECLVQAAIPWEVTRIPKGLEHHDNP